MSPADTYTEGIKALLERVRTGNAAALVSAATAIGRSVAEGGVVHAFGSGHSAIVAREIVGRAGGLACVSQIEDPTGGFVENLPGYGARLAARHARQFGMRAREVIIVVSNSGANCAPVDVALFAAEQGLQVVALTSAAMSRAVQSQHPSGKRLFEVAGIVLDNGGVPGDASVEVMPGISGGPTSTVAGAFLLNLLMLGAIGWLRDHGHTPPVLCSQNIPGGIERNRELAARYSGRLSRPLA